MVDRKLYKTQLCVLYKRGHCHRQTCSFAHGNSELRRFSASFNVAKEIWDTIINLFRLCWVIPRLVKELLLSWSLYKRRRNSFWDARGSGVDYLERKEPQGF